MASTVAIGSLALQSCGNSSASSFWCGRPVTRTRRSQRILPSPLRTPSRWSSTSHSYPRRRMDCRLSSLQDEPESEGPIQEDEEVNDLGVEVALSMLKFYKREISPLIPQSCRYVPTCSEYSMQAYKKYGVIKGTVLTAWRLCRCNPLGGSGFDPPRWFDETPPNPQ